MSNEMKAAYEEWRRDAMRDLNNVPSRAEAFYAGWQAALEFIDSNNDIGVSDEK